MITPPATAEPPQPGPLAAPSEDELVAAYRELRDQALTLPWAAVARAGELLAITPLTPDGPLPVELLRQGAVARVVALARGGPDPDPPAPEPRKRHRLALQTLLHGEVPA